MGKVAVALYVAWLLVLFVLAFRDGRLDQWIVLLPVLAIGGLGLLLAIGSGLERLLHHRR